MFGVHFRKDLSHIFTLFLAGLFFLISQLVQFFCRDEIFTIAQASPIFTCQHRSAAFCEVLVTVVTLTASSFKSNFVYLCLDVLGLCCVGFFLVGATLAVVHGLLIVVASRFSAWALGSTGCREHRLQGAQASVVSACGLSSCGSQALEHRLNSCGAVAQLPFSMVFSQTRHQTHVFCIGRWILYH